MRRAFFLLPSLTGLILILGLANAITPVTVRGAEPTPEGIRIAHVPVPTTQITSPSANSVVSSTLKVTGTSNASCDPNGAGGLPTFVQKVDVWLNDGQSTAATLQLFNCGANWEANLPLPASDGATFRLNAMTTSNHGGDPFVQQTPTTITIVIDTQGPRLQATVPQVISSNAFQVIWSFSDGSGIQSAKVEASADKVNWVTWQTGASGSATYGPSAPVAVQPNKAHWLRFTATDNNGVTQTTVYAVIWPGSLIALPVIRTG